MQSVKLRHRSPAGDGNCGQQPRPHGRWCDPPSKVPSQQRCPGHGGVGKAHVSPTVSSLHCCSSKAMGPVPQPKNLLLTCVMLTSPAEQGPATALMATAAITSAWRAVFAIILVLMNSKSPPQFRMVTSVEPAPLARACLAVPWIDPRGRGGGAGFWGCWVGARCWFVWLVLWKESIHSWTMRVGLREDEGRSSSSSSSPCSDWIAYKNYTPIHRPWRDFYYSSARLLPVRRPAAALKHHSQKNSPPPLPPSISASSQQTLDAESRDQAPSHQHIVKHIPDHSPTNSLAPSKIQHFFTRKLARS